MDWLVIEGLKPWDGRYELNLMEQPPTMREWGWIKRYAEILPLTFAQAFRGRDPELTSCFAVMALHRAGKLNPAEVPHLWDRLLDVPAGTTVRYELTDEAETEGDDAGPPALSSNGKQSSSGPGSRTSSGQSVEAPKATGIPASDTSALAAVTSAS